MASTVLNASFPGPVVLTRGKATTQAFTATTQSFQFSISQSMHVPNGLDCLNVSVVGGTGTTGVALECSLDGGTSFFGIADRGNQTFNTTTIGGDAAVVKADSYDVSGLASAMFRVGVTGITAGTANVTLFIS